MAGDSTGKKTPTIAIDAMGGDFGPSVTVPGALQAARDCGCKLLFVGKADEIDRELKKQNTSGLSFDIVHASEVAEMQDKPSDVLRRKKDSSIQVACRLVKDGQADGLVSPGHSGATVACAMFIIGRIPGVDRLGLATMLPSEIEGHPTVMLDVGANVDSHPHHLFQFGLMGSALAKTVLGRDDPKIGILSIGEEEGKGNTLVKDAYELLKMANNLNFVGNAEGRDIFTGELDVIVCDGFVGNVALKVIEGACRLFADFLKQEFRRTIFTKLAGLMSIPVLRAFRRRFDPRNYNGATLLGLKGIVVKSHGSADIFSYRQAIHRAVEEVRGGVLDKITARMDERLRAQSNGTVSE